ncbi:MAG: CO dehydrogenase/acetyl-CoA synthase complex subunit epsilon [Deltaproteobacteria bacterium]|nr:CO dehydrogenase/acetyl-CoA synthase complex subunit epsilon [Deltaproteobacteria bacterium]
MSKGEFKKKAIGEIIRADQNWEPVGPTPMPDSAELRNWDLRLMQTYKPFYAPACDLCCWCTYGKCDLTAGKKGACGINISAQQARQFLQQTLAGCSAHAAHAAHMIDYLIEKHGPDFKLDLGKGISTEAPIIRNVVGLKPETLADLKKALQYVEEQLVHAVSATHTGQEGSDLDFNSKALHVGMLDFVAMEAADLAQIAAYKYPSSEIDTPFVDIGWRSVDLEKALILCIGHNAATSNSVVEYIEQHGLSDKVDVAGICCTALDTTRYSQSAKVIGPLSRQHFYVKSGLADVILTDEQCVWTDMPEEARKTGTPLIAASDKACYGLENVSGRSAEEIVRTVVDEDKQVLILDPEKAARVAVEVALRRARSRKKELVSPDQVPMLAEACKGCGLCSRVCANLLPIGEAMKAASKGDIEPLKKVFDKCIGCAKCEQECPNDVPIFKCMQAAAGQETYRMRVGRGPVGAVEIREASIPIAFGTNPGIVAVVGCSNFPEEMEEIADIVEELARRKYIVMLSGCSAMAAAMKKYDGQTVYEKYPPTFYSGGVINVGSCVSNSHIVGAAIKVANIFAKVPLRGNFEAVADYILNRIGACGLAWGAYSQKATSIATGCNRWGIPVVLGPHAAKYKRLLLSDKEGTDWRVRDARTDELMDSDDRCPEHLITVVESKERALVEIAKLCIRRNDTHQGRQVKLHNYIDFYKKYMGTLPDDLPNFVRKPADVPLVYKREVMTFLKEKDWKPKPFISNPTIIGTYDSQASVDYVKGGK